MGRYDDLEESSMTWSNSAEVAIANELYRANILKRIEIDLLAFQAGLTKEKRSEIQKLMDEA